MFKVISAELKKILSKPGIYVLSIFLAVILIIGVFIYSPKVNETSTADFKNATNYTEKYDYFIGDDATNKSKGIKVDADKQVKSAIANINNYTVNYGLENISKKQEVENLIQAVNDMYNEYLDCSYDDSADTTITNIRSKLVNALENLNQAILDGNSNASNGCYSIVMTTSLYDTYSSQYKDILKWAKTVVKKENLADHCNVYKTQYKDSFINTINNFVYPTMSSSFVKNYTIDSDGTSLHTLNIRLNAILDEIQTNLELAQNSVEANIQLSSKMNDLANKYVDTCSTYANLIKYSLINNAFDNLSTTEQMNAMYLKDYSAYNSSSLQIKYEYLFKNGKNETEYARPLTIGVTSNDDINAYDYAYFVLKLFSFVIIAFSIMMACNTIAGEIKEGSMRYMAIRPVGRAKIIFGKYFAILILSTILSIFSGIIAVAVGGAVYGFGSLNILTIFNGSVAVVMHPIAMILIYLLSLLIEIAIYTGIALMLSTIFKSDLLSVTLMLLLYLVNICLPMFVSGINSWLTFYPFSHISLYSLFGSSIYAIQGNFINALLGAKIYLTSNIILTSIVSILLILVPVFVAYRIFNSKEL